MHNLHWGSRYEFRYLAKSFAHSLFSQLAFSDELMISSKELRNLCRDRVREAEALTKAKLYDGAYYLCGYAVEIGLKKRISRTLRWKDGYPKTEGEFRNLTSFKTHDLDVLLHLSGIEDKIKKKCFSEWSIVTAWKPEIRYASRTKTAEMAKGMLAAVKRLLKQI
jgi:hypothetical protein